MTTISALILCSKDEPFVDLTLRSLEGIADQIVIMGDPDRETQDLIFKAKRKYVLPISLYFRPWDGNYGAAKNEALRFCSGDWIICIDADEVMGDTSFLLKDHAQEEIDVYDLKYEHFIRDLGHLDSSQPEHIGINRFYRNYPDVKYSDGLHELPSSKDFKRKGIIRDVVVYHLGYLKNVRTIVDKFLMNVEGSKIHSPEYLSRWKDMHIGGTHPTRQIPFSEINSSVIKEAFLL